MTDPMQRHPAGNRVPKTSSSRAGSHQDSAPSLFDAVAEGERRKEAGMQQARHGEAIGIVAALETEVRRLAATGVEFTPDEVLPNLSSRRAVGSVFNRLAKAGEIVFVRFTVSTRPERRGAPTRVWRGAP